MNQALPARRVGQAGAVRSRGAKRRGAAPWLGGDIGTRVWRIASAPFWLWSDCPTPDLPRRTRPAVANPAPATAVLLDELDRVRATLWAGQITTAVLRGVWLGLAVACLLLAVGLLRSETVVPTPTLVLVAVVVLFAVLGLVFGLLTKPTRRRTARMLERTFRLRERMSTALDHLTTPAPVSAGRADIGYLQLADAANVLSLLRRQPALRYRPPTRELLLVCFWGLTLAILIFLRGVGGAPPVLGAGSVPHFTAVASRPTQTSQPAPAPAADQATVEEVQARTDRSNQARQDLQSLAAAMADHAMTSDAAAKISAGDYAAATDALRESAPAAPEWSAAGRNALANDLQGAAETMAPGETGLQDATTDAAEGLQQGEQPAADGMNALADAVERTADQVVADDALASQMQEAQARRSAAGGASGDAQPGAAQPAAGNSSNPAGDQQDPGAGSDAGAEPGANQPGSQAGSGADPGEQVDGQPGAGPPGGQSGENGQPGAADQPGPGGERGANQSGGQQDAESARTSVGSGAGSSAVEERKAGEPGVSNGEAGAEKPTNQVVQQRVTGGDGARGALSPLAETGETLSLQQDASGPGVQTINDGGSAMLGSGAGITAGNGTEVQTAIGEAGPDSNHVPGEYRDVVERYFSDGEGP